MELLPALLLIQHLTQFQTNYKMWLCQSHYGNLEMVKSISSKSFVMVVINLASYQG